MDLSLNPNELLLMSNLTVAHDRRAFTDEFEAERILERMWSGYFPPARESAGEIG